MQHTEKVDLSLARHFDNMSHIKNTTDYVFLHIGVYYPSPINRFVSDYCFFSALPLPDRFRFSTYIFLIQNEQK